MGTALLFERDVVDEIRDWPACLENLGRTSLLWVDLDRPHAAEIKEVVERLELSDESEKRLREGGDRPYLGDFESYLHVTAFVPSPQSASGSTVRVDCLVAERWVVTVHHAPVEAFPAFRERAEGSGEVGQLDGPELLADLLEWVLEVYLDAFEALELALEEFDASAMSGDFDVEEGLNELVEHRREIGRLRRALVAHRATFFALTRPELDAITSSEHAARFADLRGKLEDVVQAARDSRESVVGSFDVMLAREGHRTNEIMKVLTLGSLLLLPGALLAGVMGMNFDVGLFDRPELFWVVVALILSVAAATLATARARHWI
jgi:magnesium transporter